ncbi:SGNH/GDSL hydrolase family protein [Nocardia sp. CDC160]|uniref:SGNH/GDSL hydrolase family protein n=1 Tax=Nocardia sp. CDC160 TaxID=3112166 RepID=UPI002DBB81E6|nr:SGNH/GDSL hydrolase family protein [Nocardia sp. CDC160]MEC3915637.1 SGNH/GDSL hydrolase family protein [Nocardia sp. CDC160]
MKRSARLRMRAASAVCGTVAVIAMAAPNATAADTPEGKALVVIGDSFSANGRILDLLNSGGDPDCKHVPTSWPLQLTQRLGLSDNDVENTSCQGGSIDTSGWTLAHQVKRAMSDGALGTRTRAVTIQLGMNDAWGTDNPVALSRAFSCLTDLINGCGPEAAAQGRAPDPDTITGRAYADRVRQAVVYLRYYAPNARIVFVGYPEIHSPGGDSACAGILGVDVVQPRAGAITGFLDRIDTAQRAAAALLNADFLDARAVTAGHGACAADAWVDGAFDPRVEPLGFPWHPTARGDSALAIALQQLITQG